MEKKYVGCDKENCSIWHYKAIFARKDIEFIMTGGFINEGFLDIRVKFGSVDIYSGSGEYESYLKLDESDITEIEMGDWHYRIERGPKKIDILIEICVDHEEELVL